MLHFAFFTQKFRKNNLTKTIFFHFVCNKYGREWHKSVAQLRVVFFFLDFFVRLFNVNREVIFYCLFFFSCNFVDGRRPRGSRRLVVSPAKPPGVRTEEPEGSRRKYGPDTTAPLGIRSGNSFTSVFFRPAHLPVLKTDTIIAGRPVKSVSCIKRNRR